MKTPMQEWSEWLKAYEYELPLELQIKARELLALELKYIEKAIEYGYELRNNNKPINSGIDWVKEFNSINK